MCSAICKQTTETKHPLQEKVHNADDGLKLFFYHFVDSVIKGNYMYHHAVIRRLFQCFFFENKQKLGGQIRREL